MTGYELIAVALAPMGLYLVFVRLYLGWKRSRGGQHA